MTDSHICFTGIMGVMQINSLSMIFQHKITESLNAVSGNSAFCSHILLRTPQYFLKEMQKVSKCAWNLSGLVVWYGDHPLLLMDNMEEMFYWYVAISTLE